jgi:hypothetical protein
LRRVLPDQCRRAREPPPDPLHSGIWYYQSPSSVKRFLGKVVSARDHKFAQKRFNFICFAEIHQKMPKISASRAVIGGDQAVKIWSNQLMC